MEHNKEHLQALLNFIDKLCAEPENEWFRQELAARFQKSGSTVSSGCYDEKVDKIEKYLALDYQLDDADSVIDYSFVTDTPIRETLERDNREMMRYWGGLRAHKVDFSEFCRYAVLQVELLLNFYYISVDTEYEDIVNHIKRNFPKLKIASDSDSPGIHSIPLLAKYVAFHKEFQLPERTKVNLDYMRILRNKVSHGTMFVDFREEQSDIKTKLVLRKAFMPDGTLIAFQSMDRDTQALANTFLFLNWAIDQPFDKVYDTLALYANTIKGLLKVGSKN